MEKLMKILKTCAIMILILITCACAGKNASAPASVRYYPNCHQPLEEIKDDGTGRAMARGATRGALTGATAGLISGALVGLITGRPANVLTGVAVGAATGAVTGGIYGGGTSSQRDENRLMAKYLEEIEGDDIEGLNLQTAAATVAVQCYDKRFNELLQKIHSGDISQKGAQARFAEIEAGRREALAILGPGREKNMNQAQEFQKAVSEARLPQEAPLPDYKTQ